MYERPGYRTLLGRIRENVRLYIRRQIDLPKQVIAVIAIWLPLWASALIVFVLFIGGVALSGWRGYKNLELHGPTRTINSLKETVRWAKARLLGQSGS